jgi:hypothetical protein
MKKFELIANVIGEIYIQEPITIPKGNMTFSFIIDDSKKLTKIQASIIIPESNNNFNLDVYKDSRGISNFVFNSDEAIYSELISELQAIESHLSFKTLGSLESINWEYPDSKQYIPQQSDGNFGSEGYSISFKENSNSKPVKVTEQLLQNIVKDSRCFEEVNFDLAYWRIGCGFVRKAQFKLAYIHFYFIIENLYTNCMYREKDVLKEFRKSSEFINISHKSYTMILNDPSLKNGLEKVFNKYGIENKFNNLHLLLIRIRNDLHHFHKHNPNSINTPFLQVDYKPITLLIQTIAFSSLFLHLGRINNLKNTSL